jgi:o-succinylbenzoate---CoA ligase
VSFWIQSASAGHPDRVAIQSSERAITYRELSALAIDGARELQALGVRVGQRVALDIGDRIELALALHACLLHGAVAVPIDPRLTPEERLERAAGAAVELRRAPGASSGMPAPHARSERTLAEPATLMYTSGSTAAPKPVELTYGNWFASAVGSALALGLDSEERWLCAMPLAHVGGLSILIRSVIYATTAVLHERFETEAVLDELMDPSRRITMVSLVPTMLARLLDAGLCAPPTLRWALLGGAPIPPKLLERASAARVPVAPTYGMTETCSQIATFGRPLHGATVTTEGRDGEIVVRGPMVSPGALDGRGLLHTGDLGRFEDGRLIVVGRQADTIISGGENVSPAEVEAVLCAHPDVTDAGVFGRQDPEWGEAVVACVVPRDGVALDAERLRAFCAAQLASFKVPKAIGFAPSLPRTESGKLLRRELLHRADRWVDTKLA